MHPVEKHPLNDPTRQHSSYEAWRAHASSAAPVCLMQQTSSPSTPIYRICAHLLSHARPGVPPSPILDVRQQLACSSAGRETSPLPTLAMDILQLSNAQTSSVSGTLVVRQCSGRYVKSHVRSEGETRRR